MALQTPVDRIATLPGPRRPSNGLPRKPARLLRVSSDARLVELVRGGSEPAFEALFDRHSRGILAFCRHMLGSADEAEDAAQQTFLSAYSDLLGSDRPIQLRPWLYTIARNRCVSLLRARRERPADDLEDLPTEHLSTAVQRRQDLRDLLRDVVELPEHQRAALMLAEIGGASHDEIAQVLGVDRNRVKGLVFQARCSLLASREARDTPCEDIRDQLLELRGGSLLRTPLRRHLRSCPRCREFRSAVKEQRKLLGLALPVAPSVALKAGVMGSAASSAGAGAAAGVGTAAAAKVLVVAVLAGGGAAGVQVARHDAGLHRDRARADRVATERERGRERPAAAASLPAASGAQPVQAGWVELPSGGDAAAAPPPAGAAPGPASIDDRGYMPQRAAGPRAGAPAQGAPGAAPAAGGPVAPVTAPGTDPSTRPARGELPQTPAARRPPAAGSVAPVPSGSNRGRGSSDDASDDSGHGGGGSVVVTNPRQDDRSGRGGGSGRDRSGDDAGEGRGSGSNSGHGRSGDDPGPGRGRSGADNSGSGSGRSGDDSSGGPGRGRSGDDSSGGPGRGRSDDGNGGSGRGRPDGDDRGSGETRGPAEDRGSGGSGVGGGSGRAPDDSGSGGRGSGGDPSGHGARGDRGARDQAPPVSQAPVVPPPTVPVPSVTPQAQLPAADPPGRSGNSGRSRGARAAQTPAPAVTPAASVDAPAGP